MTRDRFDALGPVLVNPRTFGVAQRPRANWLSVISWL